MSFEPCPKVQQLQRRITAFLLLSEGRGFEIARGRLGSGRTHHCMRQVGLAERTLESMCRRSLTRVAFGRLVADHGVTVARIAQARILIERARLLTLPAAQRIDTIGKKLAELEIAMVEVAVPSAKVVDRAMQAHGAADTGNDFFLARAHAMSRVLRIADGPGEVHRAQIGRLELRKYPQEG
jgi:acyl-CoA dehydrogenase